MFLLWHSTGPSWSWS